VTPVTCEYIDNTPTDITDENEVRYGQPIGAAGLRRTEPPQRLWLRRRQRRELHSQPTVSAGPFHALQQQHRDAIGADATRRAGCQHSNHRVLL
jgi:hypothetical protein